jgi:hypothetical protein
MAFEAHSMCVLAEPRNAHEGIGGTNGTEHNPSWKEVDVHMAVWKTYKVLDM